MVEYQVEIDTGSSYNEEMEGQHHGGILFVKSISSKCCHCDSQYFNNLSTLV